MSARTKIRRSRALYTALSAGAIIALTTLTGGIAPAVAKPGSSSVESTTTVAPQPTVETTPQPSVEKPTQDGVPAQADVTAPSSPVSTVSSVPPAVSTVSTVSTAPQPVEASSQTSAPESASTVPAPVPSTPQNVMAPTAVAPTAVSPAPVAPPVSPTPVSPTPVTIAPSTVPITPVPSTDPITPSASPSRSSESPAELGDAAATTAAATSGSSAGPAANRVIEKVAPQTLQAPESDVRIAQSARVVEAEPVIAPRQEIEDVSRVIQVPPRDEGTRRPTFDQRDRNVRQWRPEWVQYDEYYRPVLSNPYRGPVRIVYVYQSAPRVVWIPPLTRIVLQVAQYAPYSFTAIVSNPMNQVVDVAVGSFFGGGYFPGVGMPPPPPPPRLLNYANVPVQVRYSNATYEPFRVAKIVDVGDDAQYGERKVLLDGVTPAWGQWTQTPSGERSFEVHQTQQFPGLDDPREAPLPGDYQLTLASGDAPPQGMTTRDVYLMAVAVTCGALSIGAIILSVLIGRRRRPGHAAQH